MGVEISSQQRRSGRIELIQRHKMQTQQSGTAVPSVAFKRRLTDKIENRQNHVIKKKAQGKSDTATAWFISLMTSAVGETDQQYGGPQNAKRGPCMRETMRYTSHAAAACFSKLLLEWRALFDTDMMHQLDSPRNVANSSWGVPWRPRFVHNANVIYDCEGLLEACLSLDGLDDQNF